MKFGISRAIGRRLFSSAPGKKLHEKVLVANRGEIAVRVFNTCKRLGIPTVAVYSEPDKNTKFVRMADEAVCIGPAASKDSYLRIDKIIDACKKTGATAVHPGYGFLSENAEFCRQLEANGIEFVGPPVSAIQRLGDKISSKLLAKRAGVHVVPGFDGEVVDAEQLVKVCKDIGYPVMMKPSAGGGGKGMRVAYNDAEAVEGFKLSKAEAASSFGDDRMLVEKFVDNPRHIEIQLLGDKHGNYIAFPERECSVQRRNQKVIEESPSSFVTAPVRKKMQEQAVALAKEAGYFSAGTVEMMVDKDLNFYFLEVNTRLQVEHPVTEMITGVDLVEEMLRVAANLTLSRTQEDTLIHGWATEARVYAEDPYNKFFPSTGRLNRYVEPTGPGYRCDSGITEGSEISIYYDPMICKLICHGDTRQESIERLKKALDHYVIRGVKHNIPLLRDVLEHSRYMSGDISTKFISQEYPDGFSGYILKAEERHKVVTAAAIYRLGYELANSKSGPQGCAAYRNDNTETPIYDFVVSLHGFEAEEDGCCSLGEGVSSCYAMSVLHLNDNSYMLRIKPGTDAVDDESLVKELIVNMDRDGFMLVMTNETSNAVDNFQLISHKAHQIAIQFAGTVYAMSVMSRAEAAAMKFMLPKPKLDKSKFVVSPMPGVVVDVLVKPGDPVIPGQEVLVLEAMKMRNVLRAEVDGKVKALPASKGQSVSEGDLLVEFE